MRTAYIGLIGSLGFSILLVYMLIVVNFLVLASIHFIIIMALPAALSGYRAVPIHRAATTLSVPALMGAIKVHGCGDGQ